MLPRDILKIGVMFGYAQCDCWANIDRNDWTRLVGRWKDPQTDDEADEMRCAIFKVYDRIHLTS
jgi:hypothetical protein